MHVTSTHSTQVKAQKTAFYILMLYIAAQLSSFVFLIPGVLPFFLSFISSAENQGMILMAWWNTIAWIIVLVLSIFLISRNKQFFHVFKEKAVPVSQAIMWGVIGFFLVLLAQSISVQIEVALGIAPGSENTEAIMEITRVAPIMMVSSVLLAPILEELIFRRIIFGSLIQKYNFFISTIISAFIFGLVHMEFIHILIYTATGFVFSFLYYKTKRLMTSIIAHMLLNGFVTVLQLNIDKLAPLIDSVPK